MNLILVCIQNFQEYILENIQQLRYLQIKNIYVITNGQFFHYFSEYPFINLVDADRFIDDYNYFDRSALDKNFSGGFWALASLRLFIIYAFMKETKLTNCVHIENDVLLYYDCKELENMIDPNYVYIPFDSYRRSILSIIYIPNDLIFETILDHYDYTKNDMENFSMIQQTTHLIKNFPIFPLRHAKTDEERFVSGVFPYIFDAAAIGQYVGGVDSQNDPNDSIGFVNETCVIKYNNYKIEWEDGKPFLRIHSERFPIFNLHIHSKNLKKFASYRIEYDIIIVVGPNEYPVINKQIHYVRRNVRHFRKIFVITDTKTIPPLDDKEVVLIPETDFPFSIENVADYFRTYKNKSNRNGWYFQQLCKLYSAFVIHDLMENFLILDADVFFLRPIQFISDHGKFIFTLSNENHKPYFDHMNRMHPSLRKYHPFSGISHHMMINKKIIDKLFDLIESFHKKPFWTVFLESVEEHKKYEIHVSESGASEYEIYFHFIFHNFLEVMETRVLRWENLPRHFDLDTIAPTYDFISSCHYL